MKQRIFTMKQDRTNQGGETCHSEFYREDGNTRETFGTW